MPFDAKRIFSVGDHFVGIHGVQACTFSQADYPSSSSVTVEDFETVAVVVMRELKVLKAWYTDFSGSELELLPTPDCPKGMVSIDVKYEGRTRVTIITFCTCHPDNKMHIPGKWSIRQAYKIDLRNLAQQLWYHLYVCRCQMYGFGRPDIYPLPEFGKHNDKVVQDTLHVYKRQMRATANAFDCVGPFYYNIQLRAHYGTNHIKPVTYIDGRNTHVFQSQGLPLIANLLEHDENDQPPAWPPAFDNEEFFSSSRLDPVLKFTKPKSEPEWDGNAY